MASGFPGVFPGGYTTGYENIGAVQKQKTGAAGYPGVFPGGYTTGYRNIGAVQKNSSVSVSQSRTVRLAYLAAIADTSSVAIESLGYISGSRTTRSEELSFASKGSTAVLETLKGIAVSRSPLLNLQGMASVGRSVLIDHLVALNKSNAALLGYLSQASRNRSIIIESQKGIASSRILPYEYTASSQVTVTANRSLIIEWRSNVSQSHSTLFDFWLPISQSCVLLLDHLAPIARSRSVQAEYLSGASKGRAGIVEILRGIAPGRILPYEFSGVAQVAVTVSRSLILEWAAGLSVTLDPSAVYANISKSLNQYLVANLVTTEGLTLDWGQPSFKEEGLERWLQSRLLWDKRVFQRQVDAGQQGNLVDVRVEISIFEKHPPQRNLYSRDDEKDTALEYLTLATIPVYDYAAAGHPQIGIIRLFTLSDRGGEEVVEDEGEKSGLREERVIIPGRYLEKFTIH